MSPSDEDKVMGRISGEQPDPGEADNLLKRLVYMLLIAVMISLAHTVLGVATLIQFVILLTNRVYPTRDNKKHSAVRAKLADIAYESITGENETVLPKSSN